MPGTLDRPLKQRERLGQPPRHGIRIAQCASTLVVPGRHVARVPQRQAALEPWDGVVEPALAEERVAGAVVCSEKAAGLLDGFSDAEPFLSGGARLAEFTQFGQTLGENGTCCHGGIEGAAEACPGQVPLEQRHGLCQYGGGAVVVPHGAQNHAEVETDFDQKDGLSNGLRQREPALGEGVRPDIIAHLPQGIRRRRDSLHEPALIS